MKKLRIKLKKFFGFFKISNLKAEVASMGFGITFSNIIILTLVLLFSAVIVGFLLRLDLAYCVILALFFVGCLPSMIITKFKADYEKIRFNDTVNYLEQLIYAFHKNNKIRDALADVESVSTGNIRATVRKMLDCIDYDMTTSKLYEKALNIMQEEYDCSRMLLLHNYLLEVEHNGGESDRSLNLILTDIREWSARVLQYQAERKNVQSKITISILLAMLSCGLMVNMIPAEYLDQIVKNPIYQLGTLGVLLACILLYVISTNRIGISYLDFETDSDITRRAISDMKYIQNFNKKNHIKPAIIKVCIFIPFIVIAIWQKIYWCILPIAILALFLVFHDYIKKNQCVKSVIREINKMFPAWIRSLVLHLQTENVHVAILKSYDTCPDILKGEVDLFLRNLDKDPNTIRPYNEFLKSFDTPDLKMSIHYLYSISQFGTEDMLAQLDYLVEQNSILSITEEKIRNDDSLSGFGVMTLLPMLFAVIKLIIDLFLFLNIFTTYMAGFSNPF